MSFLKTAYNMFTDNRDIKEPIILKGFNERTNIVENLKILENSDNPTLDKKKIANHLKLFSIGQSGEKSVFFELENSMLPIVIFHDVYIEFENYKAQLDFVIVTHKFILVLEVKKLFGDVNITEKGEFQRIIRRNNRVIKKEGMYSPINQVERHVSIFEKYLKSHDIIKKCPVRYAVTFANPKTVIEISENAPEEIKSRVIRHDQIKDFLSNELQKNSPVYMLDKYMMNIANSIKEHCAETPFDVQRYMLHSPVEEEIATTLESVEVLSSDDELRDKLRQFRTAKSKELDVKPFIVYTNKTLESIIELRPKTMEDLLKVEGIGPKKAEEFGKSILEIINS